MIGLETLKVLFFSLFLAVFSVWIFFRRAIAAHMAAPAADPEGTTVEVELQQPRRPQDRRAKKQQQREGAVTGAAGAAGAADAAGAAGDAGVGAGDAGAGADGVAEGTGAAAVAATTTQHSFVLPSVGYMLQLQEACAAKRAALTKRWAEDRVFFVRRWEGEPEAARPAIMLRQRVEVLRAVASYLHGDERLFDALCPELTEGSVESVPALIDRLAARKLNEPKTSAYTALLKAAQAAAAKRATKKDERAALAAFVPTFRLICLTAFLDSLLDHYFKAGRRGSKVTSASLLRGILTTSFSALTFYMLAKFWMNLSTFLDMV
jgi:hypothetical protein